MTHVFEFFCFVSGSHFLENMTSSLQKKGRQIQTAPLLILPFIPIVALIIQNTISLCSVLQYQREVEDVDRQVTAAADVARIVSSLQWERSEVAFFIFLNGTTVR